MTHINDRPWLILVDDCKDVLSAYSALFSHAGYDVSVATNGEEALAIVENSIKTPALIITDKNMPTMDGCKLATLLSQSNIPLILFSSSDLEENETELFDCYIKKPSSPNTLMLSAAALTGLAA